MNNYIKKIVEDFNFNSIQNDGETQYYSNAVFDTVIEFVDLGLPSGTLWCERNLGAKNKYEYGDYYAWGELTIKNEYSDKNYTYKSNRKRLPPEFDTAAHKLQNHYSIPTKKQFEELLKYTDRKWVENYNGTGINGKLFTSKINGNSIFMPASGQYWGSNLRYQGLAGYIWASSLNADYSEDDILHAWILHYNIKIADISWIERSCGLPIRPVYKK